MPKWGVGVDAGVESADDACVPSDPINPNEDAGGQQVLDELPEPRSAGGDPGQAGELSSIAEFKPGMSNADDLDGYGPERAAR